MPTRTYTLPFPPSVNTYWRRSSRHGVPRTYLSKAALKFREDAIAEVLSKGKQPPLEGRLAVEMALYGRNKRSYDIDNYPKGVLDALQHAGVFEDDKQVDRLIVRRCCVAPPGKVVVLISEIG